MIQYTGERDCDTLSDGTAQLSSSSIAVGGVSLRSFVHLGFCGGDNQYSDYSIAELIAFTSAASVSDRTTINTNQGAMYGFAVP